MKKFKKYTVQLEVTAPATTGESEVQRFIQGFVDSCEWGNWFVDGAKILKVERTGPAYEGQ